MELMPNELRQLLDAELAKPAEEMDTQLVSDLLDLLDIDVPSEVERLSDWKMIVQKQKSRRKTPRILRRVGIAAASVIVLFAVSFTSAKAFNWTFLLKFLLPVAQTFGIVSSDYVIDDKQVTEYRSEDDVESQEVNFTSLDELPTEFALPVVSSNCIPDGYQFVQGTWYNNPDLERCSFLFSSEEQSDEQNGDKWFTLDVMELATNSTVDHEFERQLETPETINIDGVDVTLYYNSDDLYISVSWLIDHFSYNLYGTLTEEDLIHIISSIHSEMQS
jgi:hypothetical protein